MNRWLIVWLVFACACGADTAGESISVRWMLAVDDEPEFVTDTGWTVQLEAAQLGIESMAAIAPETESAGAVAQLSRFIVPLARAHGGHDEATGRRIRAEWLEPFVFDALPLALADEPAALGGEAAETGAVTLIKVELARAKTKLPAEIGEDAQAYVRGTAEREGVRVRFEGALRFADGAAARRVELPLKATLTEGGTLTLQVRASEWLQKAELDRLPDADDPDAPRQITADTQPGRAWAIGVRSPAAFSMTWKQAKD